jgi:hypothetical protein
MSERKEKEKLTNLVTGEVIEETNRSKTTD